MTKKSQIAEASSAFTIGEIAVHPRLLRLQGPRSSETLQPRVMGVLVTLASNHNEVVTRDELIEQVWGGRPVSDDALNRCIQELRRVLRAHGIPEPILTVPRVGYRLTLPEIPAEGRPNSQQDSPVADRSVAECADRASVPVVATRRKGIWAAGFGCLVLALGVLGYFLVARVSPPSERLVVREQAGRPSSTPVRRLADAGTVAILPFVNLNPDGANDYLADGIAEELLDRLAAAPGLRVSARSSSFAFRGPNPANGEIARRLSVRTLVEGSIRRESDHQRVAVRVVDGQSGRVSWSRSFDFEMSSAFQIETDVAREVARHLTQAGSLQQPATAGTSSAAAYEKYLRGRYAFQRRRDASSLAEAIQAFETAVQIDSSFAAAHAGLAAALAMLPTYNETADLLSSIHRAADEADTAARLDPLNAMAAAVRGFCRMSTDPLRAERHLQHALALNPNLAEAHQWYHQLLVGVGRISAGIVEAEYALRLDPLAAPSYQALAEAYYLQGKLDLAETYARKSQQMGMADQNQIFSKIALMRGDVETSARLWAASDNDDLAVTRKISAGLVDPNKLSEGSAALEAAMAKIPWPQRGWSQLNMRLYLGDTQGALVALSDLETKLGQEDALQNFAPTDLWDPMSLIRKRFGHSDFQKVLRRTGLWRYYKESGTTPDRCGWLQDDLKCVGVEG